MGINTKFVQAYPRGLSPPLASEEGFLKTIWIEKNIHFMKKFKKKKEEKCSKKVTIFSSNLNCICGLENIEIWFSLFLEKL